MSIQHVPIMVPPNLLPFLASLQVKYGFPSLPVIPLYTAYCQQPNPVLSASPQTHTLSPPDSTHSISSTDNSSPSTPSPSDRNTKSPRVCRCHICEKTFSRHWLLQGHLRTHTGEKPFKCTECGKAFADKSNLRAHVQTHSGIKPHACVRCGKRFALRSYLSKHEESACSRRYIPY